MAGLPYRATTDKSSGKSTESSGVVFPLSANAAAAVAAAVGHASLSRQGAAASSSSTAKRTGFRDNGAASASHVSATAASDAGEAGGRESRPGKHGLDGRAVQTTSFVSTSNSKPRSLKPPSNDLSNAATDITKAPNVSLSRYISSSTIAPAANPSSAASKAGNNAANGGQTEPVTAVDLLGRRVWDKSYYEARAQSKAEDDDYLDFLPAPRQKKVAPPVEHRRPLQQRDFSIDLTKELGRTKIVTLQTPRMQQGGFWCDVCECLIKDSAAYLDHVNGRNHNRMLGMTMRVERAPPERVIGKLRELERQAQMELEGEDYLDNTAGGGATAVSGGAAEGAVTALSSLHVKTEMASATSSVGAPAAAGKVKRQGLEENYDDIDRIKRRLEELQKQEEERKLKRKHKKKRKRAESATAEGEDYMQQVKLDDKLAGIKEEEQDETEEQKLLKAMGLPSGFVGS